MNNEDLEKFVNMFLEMPPEQWSRVIQQLLDRDAVLVAAVAFNINRQLSR